MKFFTVIALMIGSIIWRAYVVSMLWVWFVVAIFGLPQLSIPASIGLTLVVRMVDSQESPKEEDSKDVIAKQIATGIAYPALCLLFGWITKHWM